uniref:Uncharacterized protein n=1 Tax=Romanomermis culicivorax TaxID=13658 RepID=A0A915L8H6_ROMCU
MSLNKFKIEILNRCRIVHTFAIVAIAPITDTTFRRAKFRPFGTISKIYAQNLIN